MPRKRTPQKEQKQSPLNLRTTPERRQKLEARAAASGRSLAQEIEHLIDSALEMEEQLGGPDLLEAIKLIGRTAARVQEETGKDISDYYTRARVTAAIHAATDWAMPLCGLRLENQPQALAIIEIYTALSMFGSNLDLRSLWLLAEHVPLSEHQFQEFRRVLVGFQERIPTSHDWANLVSRLDEIQADAVKMHEQLAQQAEQGTRRTEAAFNYALLEYKTKAMHFAWGWTRRAKTKARRTPHGIAAKSGTSGLS